MKFRVYDWAFNVDWEKLGLQREQEVELTFELLNKIYNSGYNISLMHPQEGELGILYLVVKGKRFTQYG